jgi:ectoine hydroxylase-related dioxygenase (phytanoyl-CoA dioxygenase family)
MSVAPIDIAQLHDQYTKHGYFVVRGLFDETELAPIRAVVQSFHRLWQLDNVDLYRTRAINSAYLTGTKYLQSMERLQLFNFIGSEKIAKIVSVTIPQQPVFINTQLFFNPANAEQKNYWHRDPQYNQTLEQQQRELETEPNALHFRVPLLKEPGIELIPGTHRRWDSDEELAVRQQLHGRTHSDALASGVEIKLDAGDLLVFSAHMIHRGLYGMDRLALDILFAESRPEIAAFIDGDCLPEPALMRSITHPEALANAVRVTSTSGKQIVRR